MLRSARKRMPRTARRLAAQIPAAMEQFPGDLKGDKSFAGAGGECEKNAFPALRNSLHRPVDGDVLIIAAGCEPPLSSNGTSEKRSAQASCCKDHIPKFFWRGIAPHLAFFACLHVDAVNARPFGRIGETHGHFPRIILGLADAFGQHLVPGFGLHDGQFAVADGPARNRREGLARRPLPSMRPGEILYFALDLAAFDHTQPAAFSAGQCVRPGFRLRSWLP